MPCCRFARTESFRSMSDTAATCHMWETIGRDVIAAFDVCVYGHDYRCPRYKRRPEFQVKWTFVSTGMTIGAVDTNDGPSGGRRREATAPKSGRFFGRTRPGEGISAECGDRRRCSADEIRCPGGCHLSVMCPLPPVIPDRLRADLFLIARSWLVPLVSWLMVGASHPPTGFLPPTERTCLA